MPCTSDPDISSVAINHIHSLMKSSFSLFLSAVHASNVRHLYSQQIFMIVFFSSFILFYLIFFFLFASLFCTKQIWCILSMQKRPLETEKQQKNRNHHRNAMQCNAMNGNNRHKMKLEISRKIIKPTLLIHIQTFFALPLFLFSLDCSFIFCMIRGQCSYRLTDEL